MKQHPNWMGNLLAKNSPIVDQHINTILIPGTHDSGTYGMDSRARTQSLTIKEQLDIGVRYLDCRISRSGSDFYFYHWLYSPNKFGTLNGTPATDTQNVLYDIRNFLIENPKEILILKFQDFDSFRHDDYLGFLQLIINYLEFNATGTQQAICKLVTLDHGTAEYIDKESIRSLNAKNMRVFLFFDVEDVPTDKETATKIWNKAFRYEPLLHKGIFGLWDPYWGDSGSGISVKDTDQAEMEIWWKWHDKNRETWLADGTKAGLYVLQSHMQELHASGNGGGDLYFNIAEKAADGNYYLNQDPVTGDFESNNIRNISHYIEQVRQNKTYNIITFDYIQEGDVCAAIVDYYNNVQPISKAISYQKQITLKLNNLTRYIGRALGDHQYWYPRLLESPIQLVIKHATQISDSGTIKDGDEILICTTEETYEGRDQLSVYQTNTLYYYSGNGTNERWTIRNGTGGEIKTGDHVTFESKSYPGQHLTLSGKYVTTAKMGTKPTRWIINA